MEAVGRYAELPLMPRTLARTTLHLELVNAGEAPFHAMFACIEAHLVFDGGDLTSLNGTGQRERRLIWRAGASLCRN